VNGRRAVAAYWPKQNESSRRQRSLDCPAVARPAAAGAEFNPCRPGDGPGMAAKTPDFPGFCAYRPGWPSV